MRQPNYNLERKLIKQGYQKIVGIDEVGRGALAGPIVAVASMIISQKIPYQIFKIKIKDSKLLSEKNREKIFAELSQKVIWSAGLVSHREIDQLGISRANILVIKRALKKLEIEPDYLLLDKVYNFKHPQPWQSIIRGDRKTLSIAVASILAKVYRDRIMCDYHQKYPEYNFQQHKGYGTKLHQQCLIKNGSCGIHRQSFLKNLSP